MRVTRIQLVACIVCHSLVQRSGLSGGAVSYPPELRDVRLVVFIFPMGWNSGGSAITDVLCFGEHASGHVCGVRFGIVCLAWIS